MASESARYFITKVNNLQSLKTCTQTSQWACKDREDPPHPRTLLSEAAQSGRVILIFSVNNQHGWHGYAEMVSPPAINAGVNMQTSTTLNESANSGSFPSASGELMKHLEKGSGEFASDKETRSGFADTVSDVKPTVTMTNDETINKVYEEKSDMWHYFPVDWKISFLKNFGERCLSHRMTEDLYSYVPDKVPINKSRNFQEIPPDIGRQLCCMLDEFYSSLCTKRDEKILKNMANQESAFFEEEANVTRSCEDIWRDIVQKVERDLGSVILACPFGSQRYNLSTPASDTDMFIVYQARTKDVLGFHPPKQTIKNSERESCDYTIHEVFRYCELLLSGDARCVETLFLHNSTVVQSSTQWHRLCERRKLFLNRDCLSKYLRDAQGTRGTKQLRRWCDENPGDDILPPKLCKLVYVIVRLLQNARDVVCHQELNVYRDASSEDRRVLMSIRDGRFPVETAWHIIKGLEDEIAASEASVPERTGEMERFLEQWLLCLRYADMDTVCRD